MNNQYPATGSPVPQVQLSLRQGPYAGQTFSLSTPTIILGRGAGNDVTIDDSQISRRHASISWDGRQFSLQDLGSSNGTFINGVRLTGPQVLQAGDAIGLGGTVLLGFQSSQPVYAPPPPAPLGMAHGAPPVMPRKGGSRWLLPLGIALGLCLLLALAGGLAYAFLIQQEAPARIVVLINEPRPGDEIQVGQTVTVHAVARDAGKVARMELWVDGHMIASQSSSLAGGASPFPLLAQWQPSSPGSHTLIARAFNTSGGQAQASINVEAVQSGDRDGDGVADDVDACPDEPGSSAAAGCPDRDGDGVADAADACPDEAGLPAGGGSLATTGCPSPGEGDRDGDGVLDAADACPEEAGSPGADGCPDRDGDGVADAEDACPDEAGLGDDGCPATGDMDGDGVPDAEDACPEEPGSLPADGCPDRDGDGIPDAEDACPDEAGGPGAPAGDGCPAPADGDRDGDGISDAEDACPDEPGPPWSGGCPDRDGDGVPDATDACPDVPGPAASGGCPLPGGGGDDGDGDGLLDGVDDCPADWGPAESGGCPDRDGDGVLDREDLCPDIFGLPEHAGCPTPPGDGGFDGDGDGIPDIEEAGDDEGPIPLWPPPEGAGWDDIRILTPVEFQALSFQASHELDAASCYLSLAGGDRERYDLETLPDRYWDIADLLGAERGVHVAVPMGEPLSVLLDCGGEEIHLLPGEGWGTYWDLGSAAGVHAPAEWDGHVITAGSSGGDDGRSFQMAYRICAGTCDEAPFPPPLLHLYHDATGHYLLWLWEGDREAIDGFKMYLNGSYVYALRPSLSTHYVTAFMPACGTERLEFQLSAFRGDLESPLSNIGYWTPPACARTVRVTFDALSTGHMGDDEWWAHGESVGPVYGNFWAQGSNMERLTFNAASPSPWWGGRPDGYRLRHTRYYPVQGLFDWISTQMASCVGAGCANYSGPAGSTVEIELESFEDLTFGAAIYDLDIGNPDDTLFEAQRTIAAEDIRPGRYRISNRNMELSVLIDVLVGPEAGDLPDLSIANVELAGGDPGQLRVHVFNSAADMVSQDLTLRVIRRDTGEVLVDTTYPGVSIPSGGALPVQTSETFPNLADLRIIIDPDNTIEEMSDRNNVYETPVRARVEFLRAWAPPCNENSCSIFDCDSEHVFHVWAGHGPDPLHIEWVGHNVRFPASGELIACTHPICDSRASPEEAWYMEGDERYAFDFEFPANENLYIMVTGEEIDHTNMDDSLGHVFREYVPEMNYGAGPAGVPSSLDHDGNYGERTPCDDTFCSPCPQGLHAEWRIQRHE